jgi:hypothetical protein
MNYGLLFLGLAIALMGTLGLLLTRKPKKPVETGLPVQVIWMPIEGFTFNYLFKSDRDKEWRLGQTTMQELATAGTRSLTAALEKTHLARTYGEKVRIDLVVDPKDIKRVVEEILNRGEENG